MKEHKHPTIPNDPKHTPPTPQKVSGQLKDKFPLWTEVCLMATETNATWRWMYSEKADKWSYRAYLAGDRLFAILTIQPEGFEVSLNLKPEEWDYIYVDDAEMEAKIAVLKEKALSSGDDPAWIHLPVENKRDIPLVARLFAARARRFQPPKQKKGRRR